jgi:hypothetical protein
MHFTDAWMRRHQRLRASLPVVHATGLPTGNPSLDLSGNIQFAACGGYQGFNQGACGNCWVFGTAAALSLDDGAASGKPQLFSAQWFDSDYYATEGQSTCKGGDDSAVATWYNDHPKFIPWSNAGAGYADGNGPSAPATDASSISQSPYVGIARIGVSQIATSTVSQAQAIANIRSVLDNNQAVILSFFLPEAGWTDFFNAWDQDSESTPWSGVDAYSGQGQAGGHLVCVVGYDDVAGIWLIQNSWGTTNGRQHGRFALSQTMNYADSIGSSFDQWEFDTFTPTGWSNASSSAPTITTQPANQQVAVGTAATFKVVAAGVGPLSYQWYKGSVPISGATAASYATPPATLADSGATFRVEVSNAFGSITSSNATLTVGSGPVSVDLILNGGFESGASSWIAPSGVIGRFGTSAPAYAGLGSAWFSRHTLGAGRTGSLSQAVTLPVKATQALLTFQLHVDRGSGGLLTAQVADNNGKVLVTLAAYGDGAAASGYQPHKFDLSTYRGRTVRIVFAAALGHARHTQAWTSFSLDNVSLTTK